jgi:hypothetical protein
MRGLWQHRSPPSEMIQKAVCPQQCSGVALRGHVCREGGRSQKACKATCHLSMGPSPPYIQCASVMISQDIKEVDGT